jgi:hypothetical protein
VVGRLSGSPIGPHAELSRLRSRPSRAQWARSSTTSFIFIGRTSLSIRPNAPCASMAGGAFLTSNCQTVAACPPAPWSESGVIFHPFFHLATRVTKGALRRYRPTWFAGFNIGFATPGVQVDVYQQFARHLLYRSSRSSKTTILSKRRMLFLLDGPHRESEDQAAVRRSFPELKRKPTCTRQMASPFAQLRGSLQPSLGLGRHVEALARIGAAGQLDCHTPTHRADAQSEIIAVMRVSVSVSCRVFYRSAVVGNFPESSCGFGWNHWIGVATWHEMARSFV